MASGKLKFYTPEDVTNFVRRASKCNFDIDIKQRAALLDGKSIEGLLALQLQTDLTCIVHASINESKEFIDSIKQYIVEDFK